MALGNLLYLLSTNETLLQDANNPDLLVAYRKACVKELYERAKDPNHVERELGKIKREEL